MKLRRVFYVTQGSLAAWDVRDGTLSCCARFADDDGGLRELDDFLTRSSGVASAVLVDVIEEEFKMQSLPKLGSRDRRALIERRCATTFRRTPYRSSLFQGKSSSEPGQYSVVHSAIVNHELLDPWLHTMLRHRVPLAGIYSVPHLAQRMVRKLFPDSRNSLFIAPHQSNKLRQVFTQSGMLRSARLSHSPGLDDANYGEAVVTEVARSRRYFERTRMLACVDVLDVHVIAAEEVAAQFRERVAADGSSNYHFIDPGEVMRKLGLRSSTGTLNFEEAFIAMLVRTRPAKSYAVSGEDRFWRMHRVRDAIIGLTVTAASVCTAYSAILLSDTWALRSRASEMDLQVRQLSETFRRENERFDPIKADSYEMKLAVDSGEYILSNRVPVPWVMNQLGAVLGDFPDVDVRELRWDVESPPVPERRQRAGEPRQPVPVTTVNSVDAVLTGSLVPFDGDLRGAFARIDSLVAQLERNTHFSQATVIAYPIDTSTNVSVSGEILEHKSSDPASFRIRLSYQLVDPQAGEYDDAI